MKLPPAPGFHIWKACFVLSHQWLILPMKTETLSIVQWCAGNNQAHDSVLLWLGLYQGTATLNIFGCIQSCPFPYCFNDRVNRQAGIKYIVNNE